ncbi:MAG: MFS transporter [Thermincola sp.]|nr:MFS transporter [Thermincola sp.]
MKEKNIIICILISIFYMVWSWSWMSFGTVYLTDIKGFTPKMAGLIQSAFGIGGGLGMILMPAVSDRIGRKSTLIVGNIIGILATIGVLNISGQNPVLLYFLLSLAAFTAMGSAPIFLAAIATESVPLERAAVAVGLTAGIGELSGAAMAPMFLGKIADLYSLSTSMTVGALCLLPVIAFALALRETAPRIVNVANAPTFAE